MDEKKTVLLVDDEEDMTDMISFQLKAYGFEVMIAHNGKEALAQIKAKPPDVIILDLNMPIMGGLEFYSSICDNNHKARYPVIALTAHMNINELFGDFDIDAYISKPFQMEKLINTVNFLLASK